MMTSESIELGSAKTAEFSVIWPRPNAGNALFVPDEFNTAVMLHIVKNSLDRLEAPLLLAIQGPKGEGKSKMAREVCSQMGVCVVALPGASLSGVHEKEPILILRDAYLHASAVRKTSNLLVVLLIDDMDTSIASVISDRRYTANTQLLNGELMYLCDDPYHIGRQETARIPLIATGNDFTTLHEPLTRHGRTRFFDWAPDVTIKTEIVRRMFDGYLSTSELGEIHRLVEHFENGSSEPIAFYHSLRSSLFDETILQEIRVRNVVDIVALDTLIKRGVKTLAIGTLIALGDTLRNSKPRRYGTIL